MIRGTTIALCERRQTGTDAFHAPVWTETWTEVEDVLIAPSSSTEQAEALNLYGKKAVYSLAIPKDDEHIWDGCKVRFFGRDWQVLTIPTEGIPENIPLRWNRKVTVARYE